MAGDDELTINERRKYLKRMRKRYMAADRSGRGRLLDEMEVYTGMHRKSVIRLLGAVTMDRKPRRGKRSVAYGADVERAIRIVWESLDYICAERLTPALAPTARHLAGFGELELSSKVEEQLSRISCSTVQRLIRRIPRRALRLPRRGPERANRLRRDVPALRLPWSLSKPGYFEIDLVHHCGDRAEGNYVHTLQMIDIATAWSERVALLGRSQFAMEVAFRHAQSRLPFPIKGLHPDNGSKFFNNHLVRIWGEEITGLELTRSRPYQKNDNRFVEQKNDSLVRAYLGNERLDSEAQTERLNHLYDRMWLYHNFFQPVFRLAHKDVIDGHLRRKWDTPATPYARLSDTGILAHDDRLRLDDLVRATNPRSLRLEIYQLIGSLWEVTTGQQDLRQPA